MQSYSICYVMMDAMSIRKRVKWDPQSNHWAGFVDFGMGTAEKAEEEATDILALTAIGLRRPLKNF